MLSVNASRRHLAHIRRVFSSIFRRATVTGHNHSVTPAQAGIQFFVGWIPACAGMTEPKMPYGLIDSGSLATLPFRSTQASVLVADASS
jgi:hypothetical protein